MNKAIEVKIDRELEVGLATEVARILRDIPEFEVTEPARLGHLADLIVLYGNQYTPMAVEVKGRVNSATARQVAEKQVHHNYPVLLVAAETTAQARHFLGEQDINFVDGLGNAQLNLPGLVVRLSGNKQKRPKSIKTRLSGKADRIVVELLENPKHAWGITDLAEATGVSGGFVHRIVSRLVEEKILTTHGSGPSRTRSLANPGALLDLWAEEHHYHPFRTLGFRLAQNSGQLAQDLAFLLDRAGIPFALTGSAAAAVVAPFVSTFATVDLWVDPVADPNVLAKETRVEIVREGYNVVFLQGRDRNPLVHRERVDDLWVVNRFQLYLDLRNDPKRGAEQAEHVRREVIGF